MINIFKRSCKQFQLYSYSLRLLTIILIFLIFIIITISVIYHFMFYHYCLWNYQYFCCNYYQYFFCSSLVSFVCSSSHADGFVPCWRLKILHNLFFMCICFLLTSILCIVANIIYFGFRNFINFVTNRLYITSLCNLDRPI